MGHVVRLPPRQPSTEVGVVVLCAQLRQLQSVAGDDPATMDAVTEAEFRVLSDLANARSRTIGEIVHKLAALERRAADAEGFFSDCDLDVLRSIRADLQRLGSPSAA